MTVILLAISSSSFFFFGFACLFSRRLWSEFERYGLARWRILVGILQLLGATGLLVGLWMPWAALLGSAGLAALMFLGVCVRFKVHDSLVQTLPALSYTILNGWLFVRLLKTFL